MPHRTLASIVGVLAFAGASCFAAEKNDFSRVTPVPADEPVPVFDFVRPALLQRPEPNESGTHLAAIVPVTAEKSGLLVVDLAALESKPLALAMPREYRVDDFQWVTDDRLLFRVIEERRVISTNVAVVSRGLANHAAIEGAGVELVGVPIERKERPLLMVRWDITDGQGRKGHVVEVNTSVDLSATGDPGLAGSDWGAKRLRNDRRIVTTYPDLGAVLETSYLPDRKGELAFGISTEDGVNRLHLLEQGAWKSSPANLDDIEIVSYGDRPGEVLVLGPRREGKPRALQFMDSASGALGDVIFEDAGYDFNGRIVRDPRTRAILGLWLDRATPASIWFSEQYQSVQKFLDSNFPNKVVRAWPADKTGALIFLQVFSDRQPSIYYLANLEKKTLALVKNSAPWIDPERMRPTSMMKFKTADGARLDAYVTLPAGASKEKPVPMVVLPRSTVGGRDTWGFNPTVQLLASRGFAVLQPNFRGSSGTLWMFPHADQWAYRKMHEDVSAATRAVLKTGIIDPARVAIVGWNFGGTLAASGAAFDPDLYRCAVAVSGTYDWADWVQEQWVRRLDEPEYGTLMRWLGSPKDKADHYQAISPAAQASQARIPVFVAYDKDEPPAVVSQSKRLVDALKKAGVEVEVMSDSGAAERWGWFDQRVELHTRIVAFLQKHLSPGK